MKKIFIFVAMATCTLATTAQDNDCNSETPEWGKSLGKVSFKSPKTWKIGNQEWSDVVMATNCKKVQFNGGTEAPENYNADCRKNTAGYGDLFSWCAVIRFQKELCSNGWRVPTMSDFVALDQALGGNGKERMGAEIAEIRKQTLGQAVNGPDFPTLSKYLKTWGGAYGGRCYDYVGDDDLIEQGTGAFYWTLSESITKSEIPFVGKITEAYYLYLDSDGAINPKARIEKSQGAVLRCVR